MFRSLESNILSNINPILLKKKRKNFNIVYNLRKNWQYIVGDKYSDFTYISDLKINREKKRVLHIEIYNSAIAFLLSSEILNIIEKITTYYGYKIIDDIKLIQKLKNIESQAIISKDLDDRDKKMIEESLSNIKDKKLKNLLFQLGREVLSRK